MSDPHTETIQGCQFLMLSVEGGTFLMGSPENKEDADVYDDEKPQHKVTVSSFYMGRFPVTQALWRAVVQAPSGSVNGNLKPSPSYFSGDDRPVEQVSWDEVQIFLQKLNDLTLADRPKGYYYRLPTEAEWEYAARGGPYHTDNYKYAGSDRLKDVGWYNENSGEETKPVGLKYPNQLGIYDLSGNVYEWCEDDWHTNFEGAPSDGSAWVGRPDRDADRVVRGGNWVLDARICRVACRSYDGPDHRDDLVGFRLVLAIR